MLKATFRFFLVDFLPFLNFRIGVGHDDHHVAVTIKNNVTYCLFFSQLKSFFKKTCYWQSSTGQHPCGPCPDYSFDDLNDMPFTTLLSAR